MKLDKISMYVIAGLIISIILVSMSKTISDILGNGLVSGLLLLLIASVWLPHWQAKNSLQQKKELMLNEVESALFRIEGAIKTLIEQASKTYVGESGIKRQMNFDELRALEGYLGEDAINIKVKELARRVVVAIDAMNSNIELNYIHIMSRVNLGRSGENYSHKDLYMMYACKNASVAYYHLTKIRGHLQGGNLRNFHAEDLDKACFAIEMICFESEIPPPVIREWFLGKEPLGLLIQRKNFQ